MMISKRMKMHENLSGQSLNIGRVYDTYQISAYKESHALKFY
jgi:hypothetical protein